MKNGRIEIRRSPIIVLPHFLPLTCLETVKQCWIFPNEVISGNITEYKTLQTYEDILLLILPALSKVADNTDISYFISPFLWLNSVFMHRCNGSKARAGGSQIPLQSFRRNRYQPALARVNYALMKRNEGTGIRSCLTFCCIIRITVLTYPSICHSIVKKYWSCSKICFDVLYAVQCTVKHSVGVAMVIRSFQVHTNPSWSDSYLFLYYELKKINRYREKTCVPTHKEILWLNNLKTRSGLVFKS